VTLSQIWVVLFDRDGTLVADVPYNGDPERVVPMPGARDCLDRLRAAGLKTGVATNQSGIGRGLITSDQMNAVNGRIDALLGPFDGWFVCQHAPEDRCECRKPKPKLLLDAAAAFGASPAQCVYVGDKDEDVEAARNAGMPTIRVGADCTLPRACEKILSSL
jgi:D-glycero-D-manno-heptose 1,7-bisphosphate phosphatase